MKTIELNYEDVEVGKTLVKTIEIWNESCIDQIYQAQRDPITNPLDHVFHLRSYTWALAPDEKYMCEIRYRPLTPFSKNVDYFCITDSSGVCLKVTTRGSSIGPEVTCSTTKIYMHCTNENPEVKRRIKLKNNSKVMATFMFNIDEKYIPFKLSTRHGFISPRSHKYITITFIPPEYGNYALPLPMLILYQEPLIIELYGYYSVESSKKEEVFCFSHPWKKKHGFKGYMCDNIETTDDLPPISLSRSYFNFDGVDVSCENIQRIPHAICLTNHTQMNLFVTWEQDIDGIFNVIPSEMQVKANQSALFELLFQPNIKDNLFGREIIVSVRLDHERQSFFPFVTSIRAIGHSFPIGSNRWIPQYEIPQTVIMPPCIPPFPVYTTFLIKKFGHLPLMFQFVPPQSNHFTVKPMLGVISENYQIIVVELAPKLENEQIYIERWTIHFNGIMKNESYIDFKGYGEYANVMFCNNNVLNFGSVFPGCQQFKQLGMRNITRHKIKYQFYDIPPELTLEYPNGKIDSNEILFQECSFSPSEPNVNYDFIIVCVLTVTKDTVTIGSEFSMNLRICGKSETGSLVAMPNELNFGEQEYNNSKMSSFVLFNFSSVNIYYKLVCYHRNWPLGDIDNDVLIKPVSGTVFAGSYVKVMISINPHTPGYYELAVNYLVRINFKSDSLLSTESPTRICNISCLCILPKLKIINLCAYGFNQKYTINTSKTFLWSSMQINNLNRILENILPGESSALDINFFPMNVNEGCFIIKLIVINPSRMPVSWIMKRDFQCPCKFVPKKTDCLCQQGNDLQCDHDDICILHPMSGMLQPNEETIITIRVRYMLIGKSEVCWHLDIGHNRRITLRMIIECSTESELQNYFLSARHVRFGRVYLGNKEGIYKTRWICNITNNDLPYSVDINPIQKLNEAYNCEVFSCLTENGIVEAQACVPLLVKFQPRMFGVYKIAISVSLGDQKTELILEGESCCNFKLPVIGKPIPSYCACKTVLFPVYFSKDCMDIWSMPTYNSINKMLIVYNNLHYDALGYEWKCQDIPSILSVDIYPRKGVIRPSAVQSFIINIYTKGYPCKVNLNIPFKFFNASQRRTHQRSVIKYNILSEELDGQFIITEKGIRVPKPWIKISQKPDLYCKTLSLRCYIYPMEDECLRVTLIDELKAAPSAAIFIKKNDDYSIIQNENELFIVTFILEGLLWDILHSRKLNKLIENALTLERSLCYSQFNMNLSERRTLVRRSYTSPPLKFINSILENILFIMIHEEFSLETAHLIPNEDIRHIDYLKTLPKQNRFTFKQDFPNYNDVDIFPTENINKAYNIDFISD